MSAPLPHPGLPAHDRGDFRRPEVRTLALGLAALLPTAGAAASQAVDTAAALRTLTAFAETCEEQGRAIWGHPLCGPVVLVHPSTRAAIASDPDPDGRFTENAGRWFGTLPADLQTANTAVTWGGDRWTMVLLPLPASEFDRVSLLAHEAFHRVQPELGLSAKDALNPHLDDEQGRLWLRMELRALAVALGAPTEGDAREAVGDALAFRAHRHRLFPGADTLESLLERHEGLAEYTGVVYASRLLGGGAARVIAALAAFENRPSFARSFAYASGPALGLLLDRYGPGWHAEAATAALPRMLAVAVGREGRVADEDEVVDRARAYGHAQVAAAEAERAEARAARLAEIRRRLIEDPTLVLRQTDLRASFDPSELIPLDGDGTYYPTGTFQAAWGRLEVTRGALVAPDWRTVRISAEGVGIEPDGRALSGDGWRLELAPGWAVVEESGGLRVVPEK